MTNNEKHDDCQHQWWPSSAFKQIFYGHRTCAKCGLKQFYRLYKWVTK